MVRWRSQRARVPSSASVRPATTNRENPSLKWPSSMAETKNGAKQMRSRVSRLGALRNGFCRSFNPSDMAGERVTLALRLQGPFTSFRNRRHRLDVPELPKKLRVEEEGMHSSLVNDGTALKGGIAAHLCAALRS